MYKRCTTEKSAAWQRTLEQTLLTRMTEIPFDSISIRSLCAADGISRKTFYRLFSGKEDVLCALIDHAYWDYAQYQDPDLSAKEDPMQGLQNFFSYWRYQKPLLDALHASGRTDMLTARSVEYILSEDADILRVFGADNTKYSREYLIFYSSGIMSLISSWHRSGYEKSIEEMAHIFHTLMSHPPSRIPLRSGNALCFCIMNKSREIFYLKRKPKRPFGPLYLTLRKQYTRLVNKIRRVFPMSKHIKLQLGNLQVLQTAGIHDALLPLVCR